MLSRFVLLSSMALFAACSDHNPLPATRGYQTDRACLPEPSDWSNFTDVVFGDVVSMRAVTDSAVSLAGSSTYTFHDDLDACEAVLPALEVELAVTRSTVPGLEGRTIPVRLGYRVDMNPMPTLNDAGQLAWDILGDPESAGEPLALGRQLGMRLFARHPDGFWVATKALFTENDGLIEFQKESGAPCTSLQYTEEPVSSTSFWEAITPASPRPTVEEQRLLEDPAFAEPSSAWWAWSSMCDKAI